ncbi:MAG: hypothetical protein ACOC0M_00120 [Halomonas sp.]
MEITLGHWKATVHDQRAAPGFTLMEATYLLHAATGKTRKEIARATGRSPATVRHGLDRAYHKVGAYRVTAAVAEAIRRGWIAPLLVALVVGCLSPSNGELLRIRQPTRSRQPVTATSRIARRDLGSVYV